jgi:DnaK suppressor protein
MAINLSGLTEKQIQELQKKLTEKAASLDSEVKELEADLTGDDNDEKSAADEVDRSSFEEQTQRLQIVLNGKKNLQYEVAEALKRIEDGAYGICEETEEPIGFKRLSAQPWTRLSLEAQQEAERRAKNRINPSGAGGGGYPAGYEDGDE